MSFTKLVANHSLLPKMVVMIVRGVYIVFLTTRRGSRAGIVELEVGPLTEGAMK